MKKLLVAILGVVLIFAVVLTINTVMFTSKQQVVSPVKLIDIDKNAVSLRLSQAIKIPTVSHQDRNKIDTPRFIEFHKFLESNFPLVHQKLERQVINDYSLLYKWQGSDDSLKPVVFIAHFDVVPVEPGTESKWTHDAYSGDIADGYIWGRGAMDMKGILVSLIEAVAANLEQKYSPKRTIYLAFGHDEEIGGENGARQIAAYLKEKGVHIEFTLDEGMVILDKNLSPAEQPVAIIGLAEKGYITLKITARTNGGHSSMPPAKTSLGTLARAITALEQNQMPASFSGPVKLFFEYLGPEMPLMQKILFANQWAFKSVIIGQLEKINSMNAMLRTTTAPTMINAGVKENVLPSQAHALVNFRILPGDTPDDVVAHANSVIADPAVAVSTHSGMATSPSPVSSADASGFKTIEKSVHEVFENTIVAPGLVLAGTDTKHFTAISENNYRFAPMVFAPDDPKRIHGTNERIGVENYAKMIQYNMRLMQNISD